MDLLKLDHNVVQSGKGLRTEEEGTWIDLLEERSFGFLDHWRKLLDVTYHQELHSSERLVVPSVPAKFVVHGIQDVCPDHRDFVDNEQVQGPDDTQSVLAHPEIPGMHLILGHKFRDIRQIRAQGKLKEGMYGHSPGIHCRNSGRSHDHAAFVRPFDYGTQEGGLSGPGLAGQED